MSCETPIGCESLSAEEAFRKLITTDSNGCPAIRVVVESSAGNALCDPYIDCDNMNDMDWQRVFFSMITVDSNGCWALRIIQSS